LANLKSLLETGRVSRRPLWELHAERRAAQLAGMIQAEDRVIRERTDPAR
jgi:hypothetical protein